MATFQTIADRALRLLGKLDAGSSASTQETADALISCNAMMDSWRNERLMCYAMRDESITIASTNTTKTVGPSGDLVSTRPVSIEAAYIVASNISYGVDIIDEEQYAAIPAKTSVSSWPDRIWYQPSLPNGTIYLYPIPNASSTLHIITRTPFTAFAASTDTVSFPPGWEEALATNLAIAIAPEYETDPRASVVKMATDSKANIKRANSRPIVAVTELPMLVGSHRSHIISDQ